MVKAATAAPLSAVLAAFTEGHRTLDAIARSTGLSRDQVDTAIAHLTRMGRIEAKELTSGCPTGGCGSCASGTTEGTSGCGASGPSSLRRGTVLVQLSLRRPMP